MAAELARRGVRTLLVDADPQGNASTGLGVDKSRITCSLYEVLVAGVDDENVSAVLDQAITTVDENLSVLPATLDLAGAEPILLSAVGKESILRDALSHCRSRFDWIILDAPPSLGLLTINVLTASDAVLVPMQAEFYALEGLSQLMKTIEIVRRRVNPGLHIAKVLLTMYDPRNRLTQQVADEVRDFFKDKVAPIEIPRNVRLSEAPSFGESAVMRFPTSKGAVAYSEFVEEVLGKCVAR